jgi:hypothetical protein
MRCNGASTYWGLKSCYGRLPLPLPLLCQRCRQCEEVCSGRPPRQWPSGASVVKIYGAGLHDHKEEMRLRFPSGGHCRGGGQLEGLDAELSSGVNEHRTALCRGT